MPNRSARGGLVRYLDLSYESRQRAKSAVSNNGFRPHGGHRGTKESPPSVISFNEPASFHEQVDKEVASHYSSLQISQHGSPAWVQSVHSQPNHTGESHLFTQQLLAASRVEQQFPLQLSKASLHSRSTPAHQPQYYRPNSSHQYMTATGLKDEAAEQDPRLGRPTRTTLLRARQRCNSAPVNSYEQRREMQRRGEEARHAKDRLITHLNHNMRDMVVEQTPVGESVHSFLVGARYNRANKLDAKGLSDYGVYVPRDSPQRCFIAKSSRHEAAVAKLTPSSQPSPDGLESDGCSDRSASPSPPPTPAPRQAWTERPLPTAPDMPGFTEQYEPPAELPPAPTVPPPARPKSARPRSAAMSVKGTSEHLAKRNRSSAPGRWANQSARWAGPSVRTHPTAQHRGLPTVYIQGTAITTPRGDAVVGGDPYPVGRTPVSGQSQSAPFAYKWSAAIAGSKMQMTTRQNEPNNAPLQSSSPPPSTQQSFASPSHQSYSQWAQSREESGTTSTTPCHSPRSEFEEDGMDDITDQLVDLEQMSAGSLDADIDHVTSAADLQQRTQASRTDDKFTKPPLEYLVDPVVSIMKAKGTCLERKDSPKSRRSKVRFADEMASASDFQNDTLAVSSQAEPAQREEGMPGSPALDSGFSDERDSLSEPSTPLQIDNPVSFSSSLHTYPTPAVVDMACVDIGHDAIMRSVRQSAVAQGRVNISGIEGACSPPPDAITAYITGVDIKRKSSPIMNLLDLETKVNDTH